MRIIGPPSSNYLQITNSLQALKVDPFFISDMAYALWTAGRKYFIDPVGVIAQSIKETGGGRFPGKVKPGFCNPCGLKIRNQGVLGTPDDPTAGDQPLAHAMFPSWTVGAEAHVQHLRAYAGWPLDAEPEKNYLIVDPRYIFVAGRNSCENFEDLSGKWATPGENYGPEIVAIARKLQSGIA